MSGAIGPLRLIGLGWYVAICIAGGVILGAWVDDALRVKPLFLLIGLFVGLVAGFYGVYRMVVQTVQETERKEDT
ncbi:MAG: AtpZ/AtpI family protein [Dehalococcoidia bacterium]|nr:AtpZ/AtpI family protein [Dehalococcoidia bacterium]